MDTKLIVSASPHVRSEETTQRGHAEYPLLSSDFDRKQ